MYKNNFFVIKLRRKITRSKITATIGPASSSEEMLKQLFKEGVDVVRLNFSHGTHDQHEENINKIRSISDDIAILGDIQGPKIRTGPMDEKDPIILLQHGQKFTITSRDVIGTKDITSTTYKNLPNEVDEGEMLYINDGIIALKVLEIKRINDNGAKPKKTAKKNDMTGKTDIICEVLAGGNLSSRKGINIPGEISQRVPTKKDIADLKFMAKKNLDFVAASFISEPEDVINVRKVIEDAGASIPIISKIERPQAIRKFDEILQVSDGIMIARGDLGVELRPELVPSVQKQLILKCNRAGKPVICATQMLESMTTIPIPTRAEASDVYNAIYDGADAVMLSGESATGKHPIKAVEMMERIIRISEEDMLARNPDYYDSDYTTNAEIIGHTIHTIVKQFEERMEQHPESPEYLDGILVITKSGFAARMVSKYRPKLQIIAATFDEKIKRQLKLSWGVKPIVLPMTPDHLTTTYIAVEQAYEMGYLTETGFIIIVSGSVLSPKKSANTIGVYLVKDVLNFGKV
ncbi:MAG: pyruvate kinase [Candidatus Lokiarchaeota archaeon]|nr:pyruvate kinase [Candidatus Lokiarchaeota archaeon]